MIIPFVFSLYLAPPVAFSWVFLESVLIAKQYHWPVIAEESLFTLLRDCDKPENRPLMEYLSSGLDIPLPSPDDIKKIIPIVIPNDIIERYTAENQSRTRAYYQSTTEPWPEMEEFLYQAIQAIEEERDEKFEGFMAQAQMAALHNTARRFEAKTFFFEQSIRPPHFMLCAYGAFDGLIGFCHLDKRIQDFLAVKDKLPILTKQEILALLLSIDHINDVYAGSHIPQYEMGLAMGVKEPHYSHVCTGATNSDMLLAIQNHFDPQNVLFRRHPWDMDTSATTYPNIDTGDQIAYVANVKRVASNCSNISFIAMLLDRAAYDFGRSQYSACCNTDPTYQDAASKCDDAMACFYAFCLHFPIAYLHDVDYLRYRFSEPPEDELYLNNLHHFWQSAGLTEADLVLPPEKRLLRILECRHAPEKALQMAIDPSFSKHSEAPLHIQYQRLRNLLEVQKKQSEEQIHQLQAANTELALANATIPQLQAANTELALANAIIPQLERIMMNYET